MATPDGSVLITANMDVSKAEKELKKLEKDIANMEESIGEMSGKKAPLEEQAEQLRAQIREATEDARRFGEEWKNGLAGADQEQSAALERAAQLQAQYNGVVEQIDKIDKKLLPAQDKLDTMKNRAGELAEQLAEAADGSEGMAEGTKEADKFLEKFERRVKGLVKRVFIFSVITMALRSLRTWLGNAVKANEKATAAIAKLKGALLTLAQPLVNVIIPAFTQLVALLAQVVGTIASGISAIFGSTVADSAKAAENLYDEQQALEGVGSAAKKAGKNLAGFDEINKLSGEDSGGGGAGGTTPDFAFVQSGIDGIIGLITGAALLAVGAILTFSGANVPIGIALMALGATAMVGAMANNPALVQAFVESGLAAVFEAVGPWIAVLGVILLIFGHILLGVSLLLAGIGIWAVGSAAQGEGDFAQTVNQKLIEAAGVIGPCLAVIGVLLIVMGRFPLGVSMFLAGLAMWGISEVASDDGRSMQEKITTVLKNIAKIIAPVLGVIGIVLMVIGQLMLGLGFLLAGIALFNIMEESSDDGTSIEQKIVNVLVKTAQAIAPVLGVIGVLLIVTGRVLLGLAFFIAGVTLFNVAEVADDDGASMEDKVTTVLTRVAGVLAMAGAFFLVVGLLLMFVPGMQAMGMGMIIAGIGALGVGLFAVLDWDFIKNAIKDAFDSMKTWWDTNAAKFFSMEYWAGLANDMMAGLFGGLNAIGSKISEWGGNFINGVKDFFGIHSPSTEFESLGDYMMQGLQDGVDDNSDMVVSAFSVMFSAVLALCTQNTEAMKAAFVVFLAYLAGDFYNEWYDLWMKFYQVSYRNIEAVISEIRALNSYIASIERNIVITITTIRQEVSGGSSSGSSSSNTARTYSMPPLSLGKVPALAQGALIPPNREFMAVLGDQKSGMNIEAPLDTMVQAFRTVMQEFMGGGQEAVMVVDGEQFGRLSYKLGNRESRRVGVNLVEGRR